jgi:hypothetical protein
MDIVFAIEVVGGAFDGAPGMSWYDDGEHPLPDVIYLDVCPGRGPASCGGQACRRARKRHVGYWTAEEERPAGAQPYSKQEEFVIRDELADDDDFTLRGRAIYAVGGLLDPRNFGAVAGAGAGGVGSVLV